MGERTYLTQRELDEIRERVRLGQPTAAFLVKRLLNDRDEWIVRAHAGEGSDG